MPTQKIHSLEDLEVHEVSVVDRPANKRRFITVKNDKGESVQVDKDGNLVSSKEDESGSQEETLDIRKSFSEAGECAEKLQKTLSMSQDTMSHLFKTLDGVMSRLASVFRTTDSAMIDRDDQDSTLIEPISQELVELGQLLTKTGKGLSKGSTRKSEDKDPEEAKKLFESIVEKIESSLPESVAENSSNDTKQIIDLLNSMIQKIEQKETTPDKDIQSDAIAKSFDSVAGKVTQLTEIVQKQSAELNRLKSLRGASNAIPVDDYDSRIAKSEDDITWPMDLNDPKTREVVDKNTSFYDS